MSKEIKCILPVIRNCGGDLSKPWHIEFYFLNPDNGRLKRFKKYEGINEHITTEARTSAASALCETYTIKLKEGWNPFDNSRIIYTSQTMYEKDEWQGRQLPVDYSIEYFLNAVIERRTSGLRKKSKQTYLSKLRIFLKWLNESRLQHMHISTFKAEHAQRFLRYLLKARSNSTYNYYIDLMHSFWNEIMQHNPKLLQSNPWKDQRKLRVTVISRQPFREQHIQRIKEYLLTTDPYMWFICETIYYTYIRPCQELTNVRVRDLDLDAQIIKVSSEYSKNRKTQPVRLNAKLIEHFRKINIYQYPDEYYLFGKHGPSSIKAGRDHFSKRFTKCLKALGIEGYSIYCWKDTGNQRAVMAGISVKEIQMQNRHHSLDITDKYLQGLVIGNSERLFNMYPEI